MEQYNNEIASTTIPDRSQPYFNGTALDTNASVDKPSTRQTEPESQARANGEWMIPFFLFFFFFFFFFLRTTVRSTSIIYIN